ncbi:hypothetical protein B0T24DRAFT_163095 [Lasiosphaeria ovina]|uniref:Secreted protein n=1 Tax=Lasiosphaeria ovina TaxID=92902 RepID=A0AAE0TSX0_9PEZI|nr:hypothetical protein B0T24DRAFT_163095 [Lasiosphaeria ovina]
MALVPVPTFAFFVFLSLSRGTIEHDKPPPRYLFPYVRPQPSPVQSSPKVASRNTLESEYGKGYLSVSPPSSPPVPHPQPLCNVHTIVVFARYHPYLLPTLLLYLEPSRGTDGAKRAVLLACLLFVRSAVSHLS